MTNFLAFFAAAMSVANIVGLVCLAVRIGDLERRANREIPFDEWSQPVAMKQQAMGPRSYKLGEMGGGSFENISGGKLGDIDQRP